MLEIPAFQNQSPKALSEASRHTVLRTVFPGIQIAFFVINTSRIEADYSYNKPVLSIDYCLEGRIEWQCGKDLCRCLSGQDILLSSSGQCRGRFEIPNGVCRGVSLLLFPGEISVGTSQLLASFGVEIEPLLRRVSVAGNEVLVRSNPQAEELLRSLYACREEESDALLRLKTAELLLRLEGLPIVEQTQGDRPYFPRAVITKVQGVREQLCSELQVHHTLPQLAAEWQLSETMLKRCFKAMYGNSVYAFLKDYRLQAAAEQLRTTNRPVTEIALSVGYENPGKFTSAFRSRFRMTPMEYRRRDAALWEEQKRA